MPWESVFCVYTGSVFECKPPQKEQHVGLRLTNKKTPAAAHRG